MARKTQLEKARSQKLSAAISILQALGFGPRQSNEIAAYTFLALLDLKPMMPWHEAAAPLRGITPIIEFIAEEWASRFEAYQAKRDQITAELARKRLLTRIPVTLPDGEAVTLSPGGQNPLIKKVIEEFCPRFIQSGVVLYIGDAEDKFKHLHADYLKDLCVSVPAPAKMPDVIVHDVRRNWLVLIEAVTSAGPVDSKRRSELKKLFTGCKAGLVFVSAFESRDIMRSFLSQISWETEVWVSTDPDHLIHFNGERFLGPYPDVVPQ